MNKAWKPMPFGDLLKRSEKVAIINPLETYKQVTVRLWGQGVILRDEVSGSEISAAKRYEVTPGQFILSKIDARNGAFGLVPHDLDGAVVSGDFPVFDINTDRLEPKFFEWKSKTGGFVDLCRAASEGTTNRVRLKIDKFLQLSIPLPPLREQRRIVAKIEGLAARIEEACRLRQNSCFQAKRILRSTTSYFMSRAMDEYGGEFLGNLIKMTSGSGLTSSQMDDSFEYSVYGGGGLTGRYSRYMFEEPKIVIGRVGARCGCVFVTEPKSWVTDNALYLTEISDALDHSYLTRALANLDLRQQANQAAQPVVSQKRINPQKIPVAPIEEQRRIVAYLDGLQAQVGALKKLQAQTAAELDALLPAILDRAFKGEL